MLSSASRIQISRAERFTKNQALGIPEKREMRQGYVGNDHLRMIDLNLFRVFNAMMELRSAVKASQALSITPSAVSHALNRLRQSIGDELFTPSRSGMQPTQRALELASAVREAYQMLELAVRGNNFAPAELPRMLRVVATTMPASLMSCDEMLSELVFERLYGLTTTTDRHP